MKHLLKIIFFLSEQIQPHHFLSHIQGLRAEKEINLPPIERRQHTLSLWHRPEFNLSLMFSTAALVWQQTRPALIHVCHWILNVLICEVVFWQTFVQNVINGFAKGKPSMKHTACGHFVFFAVTPTATAEAVLFCFCFVFLGPREWLDGNLRLTRKLTGESFGKRTNTANNRAAIPLPPWLGSQNLIDPPPPPPSPWSHKTRAPAKEI